MEIKYEFLTKIADDTSRKNYGLYRCVCGIEKSIRNDAVKSGSTKSCGCHRRKVAVVNGKKVTTHGMTGTQEYIRWIALKTRLGVPMCKEWEDFSTFWDFIKDYWQSGKTGVSIKDGYKELSPESIIILDSTDAKNDNRIRTCLERYGEEHPFKIDEFKEKAKKTNLEKYGVENAMQLQEVKEKIKQTCLEKYGETSHMKTDEYKDRFREPFDKYDGKTIPQLARIYNISTGTVKKIINNLGYDALETYEKSSTTIERIIEKILIDNNIAYEKEKNIGYFRADFCIEDSKIVIECDGLYWHSDAIKSDNSYHMDKRKLYSSKGYRSFFFREDDIITKTDIVESIILKACGKIKEKPLPDLYIIEISDSYKKKLLSANYLTEKSNGRCLGIVIKGKVVSCIQIEQTSNGIDVVAFFDVIDKKFSNSYEVLLDFVIKKFKPEEVTQSIDYRFEDGAKLKKAGFNKVEEVIDFEWTKNDKTYPKDSFNDREGYSDGFAKIYNAGVGIYRLDLI